MTAVPDPGRGIAWAGFVAGAVVSLAANVAHAEPAVGPRIAGGVWPALLLLSVEVLAHNRWPGGRKWAAAGTTLVAGVAAVLSYLHMSALLVRYGEGDLAVHLGPLAVDGLMIVCGAALLAGRTEHSADERTDDVPVPSVRETPDRTVVPAAPSGPVTKPPPVRPAKRTTNPRPAASPDVSDLHDAIDAIHSEHGPGLNRDNLLAALQTKGLSAGGNRKVAALAYYRSLGLHAVKESA
jgi:hypothetical protein